MAKHDGSELRIVEVKGSLPVEQTGKPAPARPRPPGRPTRAQALEALEAIKGAATAIERVPVLANPNSWIDFAFWSALNCSGAALALGSAIFIWDCDFTPTFDMALAFANPANEGTVYFDGVRPLVGPGLGHPGPLSGQVWCYLDVPVTDFYLFVAQVMTDSESATIEWGIDTSILGSATLTPGGPSNHAFLAQVSPGLHRFVIRQVTGSMYFVNLTAWQIPYPVLQMAKDDGSELRIVEVKGSLPVEQTGKPAPAGQKSRPAPTRAEALEAVKSMNGVASVIERITNLDEPVSWTQAAFWTPMELTGLAQSIFLSRCDFNPAFQLGYAHGSPAGGTAYFAGADTESFGALGTVTPPAELAPGQVSCYLNVVSPGFYFFVAQVYTDVDGKGYTATIECSIDTFSFDTTTLFGGGASTYRVFAVELSAGLHRFGIKRVTGGIYFESLTAWVVHPTR